MFDPTKPRNDLKLLSPFFASRVEIALKELWANNLDLFVFESWRSPSRQNWLYEQGRSRPGGIITKAKEWSSWHQFGQAVDIVYKPNNRWSWEGDFDAPSVIMKRLGFEWGGAWGDKPHYQITGGFSIQEAKAILNQHGIQALWLLIDERSRSIKLS